MNRSLIEVVVLRIAFVSLMVFIGATVQPFGLSVVISAFLGMVVALAAMLLAVRFRQAAPQDLIAGFLGSVAGLCLGLLVVYVCVQAGLTQGAAGQFIRIALPVLGGYVGLVTGLANAESLPFDLALLRKLFRQCNHQNSRHQRFD